MGNIDEYYCAAGYYCLKGNTLEEPPADPPVTYATGLGSYPDPSQVIGGPCSIENECRYTMIHEMKCQDGFISQETGLAQCNTCPTDHYCDNEENSAAPILCITQSICNQAEKR